MPITEQEGFEPPVPFGTTVFKTVAFSRSATAPDFEPSGCYIALNNRSSLRIFRYLMTSKVFLQRILVCPRLTADLREFDMGLPRTMWYKFLSEKDDSKR